MIATAAIVWAVLATGGAVAVYVLKSRDAAWALDGWNRACDLHRIWRRECLEQRDEARARAIDAEDRLRQIEQKRHNAAVKARHAQLAQRRAKVLAKAGEMVGGPGRKVA